MGVGRGRASNFNFQMVLTISCRQSPKLALRGKSPQLKMPCLILKIFEPRALVVLV